MYDLPFLKEKHDDEVLQFIMDHPFALLTGCDDANRPVVTQLPVLLEKEDDKYFLRGHMMRKSDHYNALLNHPNVLVVFTGPHAYVSATWYSDPHLASTWNYMSVHAHGAIHFLDEQALINVLRKTTLYFENDNTQSTTIFDNLDEAYTERLMKGIAAFEIEVLEFRNVFKLSQNRDVESFTNIINKLSEQGGDAKLIAKEMQKRKQELYPVK